MSKIISDFGGLKWQNLQWPTLQSFPFAKNIQNLTVAYEVCRDSNSGIGLMKVP